MVKEETKSKKRRLILIASVLLLILLSSAAVFLPPRYAKSYAENLYENTTKADTITKEKGLFRPEFVVFTVNPEGDVTAYFIKLKRHYLFAWTPVSVTYKTVLTDAYLSDEEKDDQSEENLDALHDSIAKGNLTEGDNADYGKVLGTDDMISQGAQDRLTEGDVLTQISDTEGKHTAEMMLYADGTRLKLNGTLLDSPTRLASPCFSSDGRYIYYTKYKQAQELGDEANYSGKIYRISVESLEEEEIFAFGESHWMSLGASSNYVIYSLETGETGVINLTTKEKTVVVTFEMLPSSDPSEIVFVDENEARVIPKDAEAITNNVIRIIRIDLSTLGYEEVS